MRTGKTDCGLLYAVKKSGTAVGYCSLSIRCGTRDEEGFHSGIAHFTEHALFKGTARKSARVINNYLDRLGGELNAFTTKEEIVLHATVLGEDTFKAAALLLELATSPTFPKEEIETERGVVAEEIRSAKDSPADDIYDAFEGACFEGHPLGCPILGTVASTRKITSKELARFCAAHFHPGRMALTVVAGEDEARLEKKVLQLAGKTFGTAPAPAAPSPRVLVPAPFRTFDVTADKRNHEVNAILGGMAPSLADGPRRFAAILLANILGGPASNSLLNDLLRERNGWVYGVECSYAQYADAGLVAVSLGCERQNLDKCLRGVDDVIRKMQEHLLSDRQLHAAKKQLLGQLAIASESGESQCLSMGKSLLSFGRVATDSEQRAAVEAVTAEDLRDLAGSIFDPGRRSRMVYL